MHGVGGYSWWFDLAVPTNVVGTAAGGGEVPAGTWVYAVTAVGADGGETIMSGPSAPVTTSDGTQTVIKWNPAMGAYGYNVWRCDAKNNCVSPDGSPTRAERLGCASRCTPRAPATQTPAERPYNWCRQR